MSQNIPVVENILTANDQLAEENFARIDKAGVFSINLMASRHWRMSETAGVNGVSGSSEADMDFSALAKEK